MFGDLDVVCVECVVVVRIVEILQVEDESEFVIVFVDFDVVIVVCSQFFISCFYYFYCLGWLC